MRIMDRHIITSIIFVFCVTMVVFSFLFILINTASNLDEFLAQKVPVRIIAQYYLTYIPVIIVQTSAIACLISVLFTYSNLNSHNEIIALRASGLDFWQITRPAIIFAVFIAALTFYLNEKFVPYAEARSRKIKDEHLILEVDRRAKKQSKINYLTYYGLNNRLYCIDVFDPNTYEMQGITIHEFDNQMQLKEKTLAYRGTWTGIAWKFYQVHISTVTDPVTGDADIKVFGEKLMDIKETPKYFLKQSLDVNSMSSRELYDYIKRFSKSGAVRTITNLWVDLHEKFAKPFITIVVVLAGLPLVLVAGRRKAQSFTSLGIAIGIAFLYVICNSVGIALGKGGFLWPFLAAWLAPMIFAGLAWYLIRDKF